MKRPESLRWILILPMCLGGFCAALDNNILSVCLPSIIKEFGISPGTGQFIMSSYTFVVCGLLLIFGYLAVDLGRKYVFALGTAILALSSLLAVFSPNVTILIILRCLQGLGAAMFMATGMALVNLHFDNKVRGRAFGILATSNAVASILGPIFGGFVAAIWDWRYVFLLIVILAVGASILSLKLLSGEPPQNVKKVINNLDYRGALLSSSSIILLVGSLYFLDIKTWPIFLILFAVTIFLGFILIRQQRQAANPILHAELFDNRVFLSSNIMALIIFAIMMGVCTILPLHLASQTTSASITAGFLLSLQAIPILAVSYLGGFLADKYSPGKVTMLGTVSLFIGILLLLISFQGTVYFLAGAANVVIGIGIGFFNPSNNKIAMSCVDNKLAPFASSTNVLFRNIGIALGTSLAGIIFGFLQRMKPDYNISPGFGSMFFFLLLTLVMVILSTKRIMRNPMEPKEVADTTTGKT
jgi:MFS family permease